MSRIEESVDVNVPIGTAYDQWTQFEDFPRFMEGVRQVVQTNDTTLQWTAEIAGQTRTWDAKIVAQEPDQVIAWQSIGGARNEGRVTFEALGPERTRVTCQMDVEPDGAVESAGDALGFAARRVKGDMQRFREFIERRGAPTGAWRGEVQAGRTR